MNKVLLLALVVAIALPIHGQEKGPKTDNQKNTAEAKEPDKVLDAPCTVKVSVGSITNQEQANQNKYGAEDQSQSYFQRLVSPQNLPSIGLFFAGLAGIVVGVLTLLILCIQTAATKSAAEAAKLNAQAFINSERPWIVVSVEPGGPYHLVLKGKNVGRTPAKLISIHGELVPMRHDEQLPGIPVYGEGRPLHLYPILFPPESSRTLCEFFSNAFPDKWKEDIEKGLTRVYLIGKVVYSDALPSVDALKIPHETRWCYLLAGTPPIPVPGFCPCGYEDYA